MGQGPSCQIRHGNREGVARQGDGGRQIEHVGDSLDPDIEPARPAQRPAKLAHAEDLVGRRRIEHRHHGGDHDMLRLVRGQRRLGGMIVSAQQQRAAVFVRPLEIRRLDRLAGTLDADALGIPQREHAIDARLAIPAELLRAAQAGRGELLVEAGLEADIMLGEDRFIGPQLRIERGDRRAAIAGDIAGRVQPRCLVPPRLVEQQTDDALQCGEHDAALALRIFVAECDDAFGHWVP